MGSLQNAASVAAVPCSLRDSTLPVTEGLYDFITDIFRGTNNESDLGTLLYTYSD